MHALLHSLVGLPPPMAHRLGAFASASVAATRTRRQTRLPQKFRGFILSTPFGLPRLSSSLVPLEEENHSFAEQFIPPLPHYPEEKEATVHVEEEEDPMELDEEPEEPHHHHHHQWISDNLDLEKENEVEEEPIRRYIFVDLHEDAEVNDYGGSVHYYHVQK